MQHFNATIIPKRGQAVISSGVNVNLLNPYDFYVYEVEGRKINILNPSLEETKPKTCLEAGGYAVVESVEARKFMIRVNGAVATKGVSVISTNQIRKVGFEVDDVPSNFGGQQKIQNLNGPISFNLEFTVDWLVLNVRKPAKEMVEKAIANDVVVDLTPPYGVVVKLEEEG